VKDLFGKSHLRSSRCDGCIQLWGNCGTQRLGLVLRPAVMVATTAWSVAVTPAPSSPTTQPWPLHPAPHSSPTAASRQAPELVLPLDGGIRKLCCHHGWSCKDQTPPSLPVPSGNVPCTENLAASSLPLLFGARASHEPSHPQRSTWCPADADVFALDLF